MMELKASPKNRFRGKKSELVPGEKPMALGTQQDHAKNVDCFRKFWAKEPRQISDRKRYLYRITRPSFEQETSKSSSTRRLFLRLNQHRKHAGMCSFDLSLPAVDGKTLAKTAVMGVTNISSRGVALAAQVKR